MVQDIIATLGIQGQANDYLKKPHNILEEVGILVGKHTFVGWLIMKNQSPRNIPVSGSIGVMIGKMKFTP